MKRFVSAIIALALFSVTLQAETVSQKQAMQLAQFFFNEANGRVVAPVKMIYNGRNLTTDRLFIPFYIYNEPADGFVIISAENKTFPILGYSLRDHFDPNRIGPKGKALLSSYARDIEMIRYDSGIPEEAINAWNNYPEYVSKLLNERYEATDPIFSPEEAAARLDALVESGLAEETASDIYMPAQWEELINEELRTNNCVAVGIVDAGRVIPVIVHGRKGDFYRIELDGRNDWLLRLLPSELLSGLQIADFSHPVFIPVPEPADSTYSFYDDFSYENDLPRIHQVYDGESGNMDSYISGNMESEIEHIATLLSQPVVEAVGGGHYGITLPENVRVVTVYNLAGAIVQMRTFKQTPTAFIDLSIDPNGFYFALLVGESGKTYGVKLSR